MAFSVKNETFLWREEVFPVLEQKIKPDKTIWFHAPFFGRIRARFTVIEEIRAIPLHEIVAYFFSFGYEVRKILHIADVAVYLPLDTKKNAQQFLQLVHRI
jgi:3-deoxy-D-manno-octulosonic-acid transferase